MGALILYKIIIEILQLSKDIDKSGSLEYCTYGGYMEGEFNSLPSQVEPPQIMHRVTKAQDFTVCFLNASYL